MIENWLFWAALSALFAACTAIFGKIGIEQINPDMATLIRTVIILAVLAVLVTGLSEWQPLTAISRRTYVFLALSGISTGASWLCYYRALKIGDAARVAPVDKFSVVLVAVMGVALLGERLSSLNWLGVLLIAGGAVLVGLRV